MSRTIPWWHIEMGSAEEQFACEVIRSNYINEGDVTQRFEQELARRLQIPYMVATTSGTAALFLSLAACGVGPGDEVVVPDLTFIATANAVRLAGATVVLADVDPGTLNLAPESLRRAITPKTKAVMPVHVTGRGAAMQEIMAIAKEHNLLVIEDAAEALLSKKDGKFLGTWGDAGCFSFSANKIITTGQGGAIVTHSEKIAQRLRELKDQGRPVRGTGGADLHPTMGFNFKLTNLQAALGMGQIQSLDARLAKTREIYQGYCERLADCPEIRILPFDIKHGEQPLWTDILTTRRDALDDELREQHIHGRRFWFPIHTQTPYLSPGERFPHASRCSKEAFWLPSALSLTSDDLDRVSEVIHRFFARKA